MLPYGRQSISEDDIRAVVDVLKSDFLTCGPQVEAFENAFAAYVGAKHAIAVNSATSALHLAMRVLGIGPGDRVVTSPNTFVASANCAAFVGATPDFADIDPQTYNLDPASLEANWKPDTKAVVAVHYAGCPCNMPEIARIARERGAFVIEDGCHGTGGGFSVDGKIYKIGAHPWADISTFSFHPVKTMTTGEGGILLTDNEEWAAKARLLRSHGITRHPEAFVGLTERQLAVVQPTDSALDEHGPWYYEMQDLGYNYRLTDIQCALGLSQLRRLPEFIKRRQEIAAQYNNAFSELNCLTTPTFSFSKFRQKNTEQELVSGEKLPTLSSQTTSFDYELDHLSLHLYTVLIDFARIGKSRSQIMASLRKLGVGSQVLYIPVHLQPWYRKSFGYGLGKCPNAEHYYARCLSLPLYPALSLKDVSLCIESIYKVTS